MGSQPLLTCPINVYDDHSYALREFVGARQFPQSAWEQVKPGIEQLQLEICGPNGNWGDGAVESKSTHRTLLPPVWQNEEPIELPPKSERPRVGTGSFPQRTKDAIPLFKNTVESSEPWQCLDSEGSWHQFNNSAPSDDIHEQCLTGLPAVATENRSLVPNFAIGCLRGNEKPCVVVPNGSADHTPYPIKGQRTSGGDVPFPRIQDSDSGNVTSHGVTSFPNPALSTVYDSISPLSSTGSDWTEHSYQLYDGIPDPDANRDAARLDLAYHGPAFPAAATGEWYAPECPYQCCSDASFSTMAASNCDTPDTSFGLSDSMVVSDTSSYQYAQVDADVSQGWVGQLPHRSTSEPTNIPLARILPSDRQGTRRIAGKVSSQRSECKDALLLHWKSHGMSYKEIKEKGRFAEAESTLRGRFRTLTKKKEHRVRKPGWYEYDLKLLREAVQKFADHSRYPITGDMKAPKISWKQVAEYIWHNGGSYHFGNATCKKKWEEIQGQRSYIGAG